MQGKPAAAAAAAAPASEKFKILLLGDSSVGKTAVLMRFCEGTFNTLFISTIGVDYRKHALELEGRSMVLEIWDTAGQERYRAITRTYLRGAEAILLGEWGRSSLGSHRPDRRALVRSCLRLVKADSRQHRQTDPCGHLRQQVRLGRASEKHGVRFFEGSAKDNINVTEAFVELCHQHRPVPRKEATVAVSASSSSQAGHKRCC